MPYYLERDCNKKVARSLVLFLAALLQVTAQTSRKLPAAKPVPAATAPGTQDPGTQLIGWTLKFAEEFNSPVLNYSRWLTHTPGNITPSGLQTWLPEAIELSDGQAHIVARKTESGYTSGILTTFGTFAQTYGRFEIRFRIPEGRGLEPLFQLLPVPSGDAPSIDILDAVGSAPSKAVFANHWVGGGVDREYSGSTDVSDLSNGFHIVAVEWDEEKIIWTVDGLEHFQSYEGVPHQPLYIAVSLEAATGKAGEPDSHTRFPASLDIDYIRVFSRP